MTSQEMTNRYGITADESEPQSALAERSWHRAKFSEDESEIEGREYSPAEARALAELPQQSGPTLLTISHAGARDRVHRDFLRNPNALHLDVRPKTYKSSDLGYLTTQDSAVYDLADEMREKDQMIGAACEFVAAYTMLRPSAVSVPETLQDDPKTQAVRIACEDQLRAFNFRTFAYTALIGAFSHGISMTEMFWRANRGRHEVYHTLHCHPSQFVFSRDGGLYFQGGVGLHIEDTPRNKYIVLQTPALYGNPWGTSRVFPLRHLYHIKKGAVIAWARFIDNFGTPFVHGKVPENASEPEATINALKTQLENLRDDVAIVTQKGELLEFIDRMKGHSGDVHKGLIEFIDTVFAIYLLGSSLAVREAEYGTRAQAEVHERTMLARIVPLIRLFEEVVRRDILTPFVRFNFGPDAVVPTYEIDTEGETDAEAARAAIETANRVGLVIAAAQARENLGFRQPKEGEEVLNEKPEAPVATENEFAERRRSVVSVSCSHGRARVAKFADSKALAVARRADRQQSRLTEELLADARPELRTALGSTVAALRGKFGASDLLTRAAISVVPKNLMTDSPGLLRAVFGGQLIASLATADYAVAAGLDDPAAPTDTATASFAEVDDLSAFASAWVDDLSEDFQEAAAWMLSREVMTPDQLSRAVAGLAKLSGKSPDVVEQQIRQRAIAIAASPNLQTTERIRNLIASNVADGRTMSDFGQAIQDMADSGTLPGGLDPYWENVYRTETANAYSAQQAENESAPEIQDFMWGWETWNPSDDRSRDTHAALDGVLWKKGSDAAAELGRPPFSYQCRCAMLPLMGDAREEGWEEDSNAGSLAQQLERF